MNRIRGGMKHAVVKKGQVFGNNAPYGYRFVRKSETAPDHWEVDLQEAELVRLVFDLYSNKKMTGAQIARHHLMEIHGYPHVLLDIRSKMDADDLRDRFPYIYSKCMQAGIDISCEPIPVVPVAHYFCGGILVDRWGQSSNANLYAAGEVSCTGVHGANRLASTSLLEGLVWGNRVAEHIEAQFQQGNLLKIPGWGEIPPWDESGLTKSPILH